MSFVSKFNNVNNCTCNSNCKIMILVFSNGEDNWETQLAKEEYLRPKKVKKNATLIPSFASKGKLKTLEKPPILEIGESQSKGKKINLDFF